MTLLRLLTANLFYFWRGNLAVLLGVAVGCMVLTGALLVGDSLQGSLREQSRRRLGWVTHSLVAPRFFRQALATEVANKAQARVVPALMLQATVKVGDRQVRGVTVVGVTPDFFDTRTPPYALTSALAKALEAVGDEAKVTVVLQKASELPREAVLAKKEPELKTWDVTARVLGPDDEGDAFNLRADLTPPRNLFVPLDALQKQLDQPGRANALVAAGETHELQAAVAGAVELEDWGLELRTPASRARALVKRYGARPFKGARPAFAEVLARGIGVKPEPGLDEDAARQYFEKAYPYLALESRSLLLPGDIVTAAEAAAKTARLAAAPTLVYLSKIRAAGRTLAGVVAALDPAAPAPLGPFLPPGMKSLADGQIVLADYPGHWARGKRPAAGDEVTLHYKPPESHGPAPDRTKGFRFAGFIPLTGAAADPYLTPEFPGITDKDDLGDWQLPFDDPAWDQQRVRLEYTTAYWDEYRATPKAYVTLQAGQALWGSRFGDATSVRLAPRAGSLAAAEETFKAALKKQLRPEDGGFVWEDNAAAAREASQGGTPFGLLFLGFSFFLIVAALLLVGLLYRLELERRARQVGLLFAEGFRPLTVNLLHLGEGGLVALAGVVAGTVLALLYSRALLQLLAYLWPGGVLASFLAPHASVSSINIGAAAAFAVSVATIALGLRFLGTVPPRALLAGRTSDELAEVNSGAPWWTYLVILGCVVGGAVLLWLGPTFKGHEAKAGTFFGSGALFLTAGLFATYAWMRATRGGLVTTLTGLGLRNAARNPLRSLLTVGLLASAAFLIVAVESFRRHARAGDGSPDGPDGGFSLIAETDLPVVRDLNAEPGRNDLLNRFEQRLGVKKLPAVEVKERVDTAEALLKETRIVALRARAGDDASCLNLYKPRTPRIVGVPRSLIDRGGFQFDNVEKGHAAAPWQALVDEKEPYAAFGESNTLTWMLRLGMGGTIEVPDERGANRGLRIAGMMHDSVFQSSLLVSEENFLRLYPGHEGYHLLLIAPPPGRESEVRELLEVGLLDSGIEVTRSADRLAAFLQVENTYLTTFQALGGLGLVLGSLGLAVVLLRAVWERRAELALMRAMGYRQVSIAWLMLVENGLLLLLGLAIGTTAAVLSIIPQLRSGEGSVPWPNLAALFAGVLLTGLLACAAATWSALQAPLVPALRRE